MTRVLTILAAVVALAVSAAPVASAGNPRKPPPRGLSIATSEVFELNTVLKRPRAISTRSGGEVVSDFARSKPRPAGVYDHGLTQVRQHRILDADFEI